VTRKPTHSACGALVPHFTVPFGFSCAVYVSVQLLEQGENPEVTALARCLAVTAIQSATAATTAAPPYVVMAVCRTPSCYPSPHSVSPLTKSRTGASSVLSGFAPLPRQCRSSSAYPRESPWTLPQAVSLNLLTLTGPRGSSPAPPVVVVERSQAMVPKPVVSLSLRRTGRRAPP
jgi:hypothetical protein